MSDPNFANVVLLLHCDGADGSTTFTDSSGTPKTVTPSGNAQVDTAQSQWGGASLLLDGTGDRLSVASNAAFGFGTGAWTCEAWVRPTAFTTDRNVFDFRPSVSAAHGLLYLSSTGRLAYYDGTTVTGNSGTAASTAAWQHVAWCYDGTTLRAFLGGVQQWSSAVALNFSTARPLVIGANFAGTGEFAGHIDDVRITAGVARYTANFTPPAAAFPNFQEVTGYAANSGPLRTPSALGTALVAGYAAAASPLGAVAALARQPVAGRASAASPLGAALALGLHDFTALVAGLRTLYVMDLDTPDGVVRAPISSWQATLQTGLANYLQCVIPACEPYLDAINAATAFTIYRKAALADGTGIEYPMATSPVGTRSMSRGTSNWTAVIDGYADALPEDADPPAAYDRTLEDVRAVFTQASGLRVRCGVDWLLRPAMRALLGETPFIVSYINYYVTGSDQFMDVGERIEAA